MKELYLNRHSPFLHLKSTNKCKPKAITERKSRNIASFHGINDNKLKELLTTYLQTQPSQTLSYVKSGYGSFDKHNQETQVASHPDMALQKLFKYKRVYPQQMRAMNNKLRLNNNNKNTQLRVKRNINRVKAESMFDFVNVLKPHLSHRSGNSNAVMNIVNNLNGETLSQTSRGNKNVEINFNKYEIRILSNKKESNNSKEIAALKECVSKQIENQEKDKYHNDKDANCNDEGIIDSDKESNEEGVIAPRVNQNNGRNSRKQIISIEKQQQQHHPTIENENCDASNNIICLKQPKKMTQLLYRNNSLLKNNKAALSQSKEKNESKDNNEIEDRKEDTHNNNTKNVALINDDLDKANNNNTDKMNFIPTQPQFTCCMEISNQNALSFRGIENTITPKLQTKEKMKLSLKKDPDQEQKAKKYVSSQGVDIPTLKLNANFNILRSSTKRSNHSKEEENSIDKKECKLSPRKELSKFCKKQPNLSICKKSSNTIETLYNHCNSKLVDSSDISFDDEEGNNNNNNDGLLTHQKATSFNSNFILNNLQIQNLKKDLNKQEYTSTEATNTKTSTEIMKGKDNSAYSFLLKRAASNVLSTKNSSIMTNPLKLKLAMSPKKNKRFLKQLSKISEISTKKQINPKKDKLIKAKSLPLISIEKISNILEIKKPSRQLTTMNVIQKQKLSLSHHNSFKINQKNVIQEEQLSEMNYSKESSSSSKSKRTRSEMKKRPSVLSNSTGGMNFFEMRANSIQINTKLSRCFSKDNRVYCQSFIEKFIDEIKLAQNDIDSYSTEAKNDLLHKTILNIDLRCEQIEEQRRQTNNQFAKETISHLHQSQLNVKKDFFLQIDEQFKSIKDNNDPKGEIEIEEKDIMNEYRHYSLLIGHQLLSVPSILSFRLFDQYYEVDILTHLEKDKYIESDFYEGEMSIFSNFAKVSKERVYKKLRTSLSIRKSKSIRKSVTFKAFKNHQVSVPIINPFEFFKFIQMDDIPLEDKTDRPIDYGLVPTTKKSSSTPRKTLNRNESKLNPKRRISTMFKKNSTRLSVTSRKSFDDNLKFFGLNTRRDSVLHKKFYSRQRDSFNNFDFNKDHNTSFYHKVALNSKKREELYMSPLKYRGAKRGETKQKTFIVKDFLHFNKESVMFKTYEIKTKLLTEMGNYIDTMFFYIKDANFQNFKDMFLKYKVSPEVQDEDGNSFLNVAVQSASDKIVLFLLNNSSNVNTQNKLLNSPLHYALSYKNFSMADILIKFGSNEKLKNRFGKTPWECLNNGNSVI